MSDRCRHAIYSFLKVAVIGDLILRLRCDMEEKRPARFPIKNIVNAVLEGYKMAHEQ